MTMMMMMMMMMIGLTVNTSNPVTTGHGPKPGSGPHKRNITANLLVVRG